LPGSVDERQSRCPKIGRWHLWSLPDGAASFGVPRMAFLRRGFEIDAGYSKKDAGKHALPRPVAARTRLLSRRFRHRIERFPRLRRIDCVWRQVPRWLPESLTTCTRAGAMDSLPCAFIGATASVATGEQGKSSALFCAAASGTVRTKAGAWPRRGSPACQASQSVSRASAPRSYLVREPLAPPLLLFPRGEPDRNTSGSEPRTFLWRRPRSADPNGSAAVCAPPDFRIGRKSPAAS